ncbi:MAG: GTP cyclohydrolase II [Patescibacteria group bacterium]
MSETTPKGRRSGPAKLPTLHGDFDIHVWKHNRREQVALIKGSIADGKEILVRIHSECLTGDAFASLRCDCGPQLQASMKRIQEEGRGIIVYLDGHEGRGIGVFNKIAAYGLQDKGMDTFAANVALGLAEDYREYSAAAHILKDLHVKSVRLLTNNPDKATAIRSFGIKVLEILPLVAGKNKHNEKYLRAKAERGHTALSTQQMEKIA